MRSFKSFYHRLIPPPIRYPIGRLRRRARDRYLRWTTPGPLPPRGLLTRIQETPYVAEYLEVGERAAHALRASLGDLPGHRLRILDFGCGLGRTLRFLETAGWELHGCDVDDQTLGWTSRALPFASFRLSSAEPPLPYPSESFDVVYAVSVFTHFDAAEQTLWATELARVLRPDGRALISTMGPRALENFSLLATGESRERFAEEGFLFHLGTPDGPGERGYLPPRPPFSLRGAFHTREGVGRFFGGGFDVETWIDGGLDGFQDLTRLRRK